MIAKADNITHGSNAVRYSADKELAEIVKVGHLPEGLTTSSIVPSQGRDGRVDNGRLGETCRRLHPRVRCR